MRRFRVWLIGITAGFHAPFVLALHGFIPGLAGWAIAIATAIGLTFALPFRLRLAFDDHPISSVRRFFERLYYAHWAASLASVPIFLVALPIVLLTSGSVERAGTIGYGTAFALAIFGVFYRSRRVVVRELSVPLRGLPQAFDGYRIVQLSDIHVGSLCPPALVAKWVVRANALQADLVALTGDYVTAGTRFHEVAAIELSRLQGRDGVVAVLGNHDNFGGSEPLSTVLRERGVRLLKNENFAIERNGERITIAGVDDIYTRSSDVERTLEGASHPVVALAHDPRLFPELAAKGVALTLSGHTHWGQVGLPFLSEQWNLARRAYRHASGLYRQGDSTLYVHPGLGTTGPPVRLGVAPEITLLTLTRA